VDARRRRRLDRLLTSVFGHERLRDGQQAAIEAVLDGRHTLAIMPTGAGKSLCYQLPALVLPGTTVVVSPLIALMKDQHERLLGLGLGSAQINSALPADVAREAHADIGSGSTEFVFTTPEQLAGDTLLTRLKRAEVDLFVIDEAHCISTWGHDFRPAYLELPKAIRALGTPTVLALTATAPPEVVDDINRQLGLGALHVVTTGAQRENLFLAVRPVTSDADKMAALLETLRQLTGSGIVYAATIRHVEDIAQALRADGIDAVPYHGRLAARVRHEHQDAFMGGAVPIVVATNAFGMGIDKADIRFVIHFDMPASIDAYYQEAGRAGRDGAPASCTLLFRRSDKSVQAFFMAGRYPAAEDFERLVAVLPAPEAPAATTTMLRAALAGVSASKLRVMLTVLASHGLAVERRRGGAGWRQKVRLDPARVAALVQAYEARARADRDRLDQMIAYAQTARCRWVALLEGLGEVPPFDRCGHCDTCQGTAIPAVGRAEGVRPPPA
jgi:ATP-dependent DNA helicase RecQ